MFRVILYLIFAVILISVLRAILRIISKGFGELMSPGGGQSGQSSQSSQASEKQVPLTGELKKDPACGTYIAAATSIQEKVGGETFYFCSKQCRDKYVASLAR
jgi:YHS domain-containing protein